MAAQLFSTNPLNSVIYTLSLHDALPISYDRLLIERAEEAIERAYEILPPWRHQHAERRKRARHFRHDHLRNENLARDRKSTRLNSSHRTISYAVFCLKKKNTKKLLLLAR